MVQPLQYTPLPFVVRQNYCLRQRWYSIKVLTCLSLTMCRSIKDALTGLTTLVNIL